MTRRLVASYLIVVLVVLLLLEIPLGVIYSHTQRQDLVTRLERDAFRLAARSEHAVEDGTEAERTALGPVLADYAQRTGGRVVVVDGRGTLIHDSDPPEPGTRSFSTRPEIARALEGNVSSGTRFSDTLGTEVLAVAVPIASGTRLLGAVRVSFPTSTIDQRVTRYWLILAGVGGIALVVAAGIGWVVARWVSRPLRRLEAAVEGAGGDLSVRAPEDRGPPEVRAVGAAFNDMVGKLDELMGAQEAFVADASHQLRTPLTALELRLENLERDITPDGRAGLESALLEVERLAHLVDGLLMLARADRRTIAPAPIDVARVMRDRVEAWSAFAAEQGVSLEAHTPTSLGARAGDGALEQILDNLIANAVEACPAGTSIIVDARAAGGEVVLSVVDHGPGMTAEQRAHAFDRFWRAGSAGEGSGLGLAIVRRLARADGGDAELREAPGGGLEARVRLRPAELPVEAPMSG
jgi:signal transduction histidine kinase